MRRTLATLTVLTAAGFANADIAIPPPKGKKFVDVKSTVKLENEVKGYVFFTRANAPGQRGAEPKKFDIGTKEAVKLPEWGNRSMSVYAVPEDLVPKLTTAKEWNKALWEEKKSVILTHDFPAQEAVDKDDDRKQIDRAFVIKSVDAKGGIVVEEVKPDGKKEEPKAEKKDKEEQASAAEPRHLIAGASVAAGVALAGLWAVRRRKT